MEPKVIRGSILWMQVCIPATFTDYQIVQFCERSNPCGTTNGWFVVRDGNELLAGAPARLPCDEREGCVHVLVTA